MKIFKQGSFGRRNTRERRIVIVNPKIIVKKKEIVKRKDRNLPYRTIKEHYELLQQEGGKNHRLQGYPIPIQIRTMKVQPLLLILAKCERIGATTVDKVLFGLIPMFMYLKAVNTY